MGLTMIFPHYSEPIFDSMIHLIPCLISGSAALIKPADYNHFLGPYLEKKALKTLGFDLVADIYLEPEDLAKLSEFRYIFDVIMHVGRSRKLSTRDHTPVQSISLRS